MSHHATRTLRELGYRLTPQRTLVWDVLRAHGSHMSAEEVCERVNRHFPNVNISTVYRTLDLLVALNLVRETLLGPEHRTFEIEEEDSHHHLVCRECGSVEHIHDPDLGDLPASLERSTGFVTHEVNVFGSCRACRESGTD
ncbi:MAG: transcriptional repressor [Actinobacteria bacterium]|nr:transcriptional repressor [Actinomycetota bacterium]